MSGKFCAVCLEKDVRRVALYRLADSCDESLFYLYYREPEVHGPIFSLLWPA